ncbi:MAG TPA: sugar ABC transporter permease [Chloroflexota bacterium]|jgi:multiple sugar transport system permease protein|nr:sugar ABC transporter permease [Chloroflexota bacterium]
MSLAEGAAAGVESRAGRPAWHLADLSESRRWAYYLLLPSLIMVAAVAVYPVGSGVWMSFQRYNLLRAPVPTFIGLDQYAGLADDPVFWTSVRNTVVFVAVGVTSQFLLGLITALALNRPGLRAMPVLRVGLLLPWLMPTVVAGHMWSLLLDSRLGVVNDLLVRVGAVPGYVAWFAQAETAMWAVLMVDLWRNFPFFTLLLLAGLQGLPDELYEAAEVDGAGAWYRFLRITLPLLTPVIVAAVILRVIGLVNAPDLMIILTHGGPGLATHVLSLLAFNNAYTGFNFGAAAAVATVMLVLLMMFTTAYVRVSGVARD